MDVNAIKLVRYKDIEFKGSNQFNKSNKSKNKGFPIVLAKI